MTASAELARIGDETEAHPRATYFGRDRRLFGVFDEAVDGASERGVVLCYPVGSDYDSAFRSFRVLGTRLARAGFHVLRFDYFGTGDSLGGLDDVSVDEWTSDIASAVAELRASRRVRDVTLIGLRLGAALAALATAHSAGAGADRLVLWQPVVDGGDYMEGERALHEAWMREERRNGRRAPALDDEMLGYLMPGALREDIARIELASLAAMPVSRVQVLSQAAFPGIDRLVERLESLGAGVDAAMVDGPTIWSRTPLMPEAAVPTRVLQSIVSWVDGASR